MFDLFSHPEKKTPREHQTRTIDLIRQSLGKGNRKVVAQLPTGAGKTFMASMIANMALAKGNSVTFTVPALSLIDQTVEAFEAEGLGPIGVIQANHPRTDYGAPVQVASVQTLARRSAWPDTPLVIVDECHVRNKAILRWMEKAPSTRFIGLTATPWRRGMGAEWDDLVIGSTIGELIGAGLLSDFRVYAPAHPDLTGVKTTAGDYNQGQLSEAMQQGTMVADVVETWLARGEDRPTLCFGVDRAHAKHLQERFEAAGVPTGYVDSYTDPIERKLVQARFERGEIRVVCNVGCLTTGVDWDVRCIILARPTKSEMLYVQMIGRGLRTANGKDDCLILDHADNTLRMGFVTDIHHDQLDDGERRQQAQERKEPLPKECGKCAFVKPPKARVCPNCGHEAQPPKGERETLDGELVEVTGKRRKYTKAEKQEFYSGLIQIAVERGRADGWVAHTYREKFGVWPKGLDRVRTEPTDEVRRFVKAKDIRFAKRRRAA